jgi:hypothetical protein
VTCPLHATLTLDGHATATWGNTTTGAGTRAVSGHVFTVHAGLSPARLLGIADVIHASAPGDWLTSYPGCTLAVIDSGRRPLAITRGNRTLRLPPTADPIAFGAFLYAWLLAGCEPSLLCTRPVRTQRQCAERWDQPRPFSLVLELR